MSSSHFICFFWPTDLINLKFTTALKHYQKLSLIHLHFSGDLVSYLTLRFPRNTKAQFLFLRPESHPALAKVRGHDNQGVLKMPSRQGGWAESTQKNLVPKQYESPETAPWSVRESRMINYLEVKSKRLSSSTYRKLLHNRQFFNSTKTKTTPTVLIVGEL